LKLAVLQPEIVAGQQKRKASSKITDENFVGESIAVTKCLKLSATQRAGGKPETSQQRQASVEDIDNINSSQKNH
jgi:hypothetical protein